MLDPTVGPRELSENKIDVLLKLMMSIQATQKALNYRQNASLGIMLELREKVEGN